MNRHQRRAAGLRGPAYRNVSSDTRPRYVRRHLHDVLVARVRTRRLRKAVARMKRAALRMGLMKGQ